MLGARQFRGDFVAEQLVSHHAITIRHALFGITAVEGFDPDQRGGRGRTPVGVARADDHAADGHLLGQRQPADFEFEPSLKIERLDLAREKRRGNVQRIRSANAFDQNVLAIGGRIAGTKQAGFADKLRISGARVHQRELRGGVVVEQVFVERIREQILKRPRRRDLARGLLHARPGGHARTFGGFAAPGDERLAQQVGGIGHPLKTRPEDGVQRHIPQPVKHTRCRVTQPQFHTVRLVAGHGEQASVRRPLGKPEIRTGWHGEDFLHAGGDVLQRQAHVARRAMRAVALGIDAITREGDHRLGQFGKGGIQRALHQHQTVAFWTERDDRRRRHVENLADGGGGLLKLLLGRGAGGRRGEEQQRRRDNHGDRHKNGCLHSDTTNLHHANPGATPQREPDRRANFKVNLRDGGRRGAAQFLARPLVPRASPEGERQ